jgi:hypothetical protein
MPRIPRRLLLALAVAWSGVSVRAEPPPRKSGVSAAALPDVTSPRPKDDSGRCVGVPTGCAALGPGVCERTQGCAPFGTCAGAPASCASQSSSTCAFNGCAWSGPSGRCSGKPTQCETWATDSTCQAHAGCAWQRSCIGTPAPCPTLTNIVHCLERVGCLWQPR